MNRATTGSAFMATLKRDLLIAVKRRNDIVNPFVFFVIVVSLFPIGISPESAVLRQIAPGVVWIAALLASMLSMDSLYRADFEDGSLEQLLLNPNSLYLLVFAKNIAHWTVSGLPVIVVSPLLAYMLSLPAAGYPALIVTLLLGTPVISLLGSIAVALTVGPGQPGAYSCGHCFADERARADLRHPGRAKLPGRGFAPGLSRAARSHAGGGDQPGARSDGGGVAHIVELGLCPGRI